MAEALWTGKNPGQPQGKGLRASDHRLHRAAVGEARRVEIQSYLAALSTAPKFVILDDDAEEIGLDFGQNFIHVPDGLEDEHVERACQALL